MTEKLSGYRALVTGASKGIGRATALALAGAGCAVGVHYFTDEAGAQETAAAARKLGARAEVYRADCAVEAEADALCRKFLADFGGIELLVANAGDLVARAPLEAMTSELFDRVFAVNVRSAFLCARAVVGAMQAARRGQIIFLSSIAGENGGGPGASAYVAAKGALIAYTRALAKELAPFNIRVNNVSPGVIDGTNFHARFSTRERLEKLRGEIPLGRLGLPEDCARAILYLARETDGFLTGVTLDVNGGQWMG